MKNLIKGASGQILGWTVDIGPRINLFGRDGNLLGWYDRNTDKTHDRSGNVVAFGNQVSMLLR